MRKVIVSKYKGNINGIPQYEEIGEAVFHQFGVDYEEFESGPGNYSTAIIEWPSGSIENLPFHLVRFIERDNDDDA